MWIPWLTPLKGFIIPSIGEPLVRPQVTKVIHRRNWQTSRDCWCQP